MHRPRDRGVEVVPFRVEVSDEDLDDLRLRLTRTRWTDEPDGAEWDYGTPVGYLRELVSYWLGEFDWRAQEERLNELDHARAVVDGVGVHFVHREGVGPAPLPLLLVHGWPTGFPEMTRLIPLLADPAAHGADAADAFHVVVPSLPGYSFSDAPPVRGYGYRRAAGALQRILTEALGYRRYGLHGTGAGAYVNGWLALEHPGEVVGTHTHDPTLFPTVSFEAPLPPPSEEEVAYLERSRQWAAAEGAYAELHRTKPQSLAHGLNDSPAGLAAWLVEKHRSWSDCDGDVETRYSKDELLTGITIHWATGHIGSSVRAYYERVHADPPTPSGVRLPVPTGVAMPRADPRFPPRRAPREMVERVHNLHHWVDLPRGGHFASWEEPELVADSIRSFFRPLR